MKTQSGAAKVELLSYRDEISEVPKFNFLIHTQDILIGTNKILDILQPSSQTDCRR